MLDLTPSRKKVERAEHKFNQIVSIGQSWLDNRPYSAEYKLYDGVRYLMATRHHDLPDEVTWELVEAVGHLRSALDKALVALVEANGRGTSGVGFPFGGMSNGKPEAFPSERIRQSLGKKLTEDQFAFLVAQNPYPGGNDFLWAINEIANSDKHRKDLVAAVPRAVLRNVSMQNGVISGRGLHVGASEADTIPNDPDRDTVLLSYGDSANPPRVDASIAIDVVFKDLAPVEGRGVLSVLAEQIKLVKKIVDSFQTLPIAEGSGGEPS